MPPKPKVKGKKRKGAPPTPQMSKNKRAHRAQVFTQEESLTDEEVSFLGQGNVKQQMRDMMGLLSALSEWVKAVETQQSHREESPAVIPPPRLLPGPGLGANQPRKSDHHMSAAARRKVALRMRALRLPEEMSSDGRLGSDEDQPFTHKCRPLSLAWTGLG